MLFVIGAWIALDGLAAHQAILRSPPLLLLAVLFLLVAAAVTYTPRIGSDGLIPKVIMAAVIPNDKTNLAPYRIAHFLALVLLVSRLVPRDAPGLAARIWRPLIVCSQRSLEVFCTGVFLAFIAHFVIELVSDSLPFQIAVSITGIGLMTGVAYIFMWAREFPSAPEGRK